MGMAVGNGSPAGDEDDGGYRPMAEINITPMVDVMLVLLIIFMVAAPLMVAGVPLELPNTSAARVSQSKKAMVVSLDGTGALYQQLYQSLRHAILAGQLAPGTRLPATRTMARELGVSRNTVLLAYEQLLAEGYAVGQTGSGTYVASSLPDAMLTAVAAPEAVESLPQEAAPRLSAYGRLIGATDERTAQILDEITDLGIAEREDGEDGTVTLWCRRMVRDASELEAQAEQRKQSAANAARTRWAWRCASGGPTATPIAPFAYQQKEALGVPHNPHTPPSPPFFTPRIPHKCAPALAAPGGRRAGCCARSPAPAARLRRGCPRPAGGGRAPDPAPAPPGPPPRRCR